MKRIVSPMIGGMIFIAFFSLFVIPVIYHFWRNSKKYISLKKDI